MSEMVFLKDFRKFGLGWRLWMLLLQIVNLVGPLIFIGHPEAWVVFAGYVFAAVIIVPLHRRLGWVRLLGVGHFLWFLILPWIAVRYSAETQSGLFGLWLLSVLIVDGISLVIDIVDVLRYLSGERNPIV
ncbi:MAG TPA: hypothetical protein ENO27_01995 [Caldithrix sp.]|nr:hypothetical protein [Caldithrix sp.]